jgi:hypothetical protein
MSGETAFVWNDTPFSAALKKARCKVLTTREDVARELRRRRVVSPGNPLVVLAEWAPENCRPSEFEGLKLIAEIVSSMPALPQLAWCSFAPLEALAGCRDIRGAAAKLMFPFIQLPATATELESAAETAVAPSRMVQIWVRDFRLKNPFEDWVHSFRNASGSSSVTLKGAIQALEKDLRYRRDIAEPLTAGLRSTLQEVRETLAVTEALGTITPLKARIVAELQQGATALHPGGAPRREHLALLVVEDNSDQREKLGNGLRRFFDEVAVFPTGESALEKLKECAGSDRQFGAVVSDWELCVDGKAGGMMHPRQGPDVLLEAAQYCLGPLVGWTSLEPQIVASILNAAPPAFRGRLSWFPKGESDEDMAHRIEGLAHHIIGQLSVANALRAETPAHLGLDPWVSGGLADHYVAVRQETRSQQDTFFGSCSANAKKLAVDAKAGQIINEARIGPRSAGARWAREKLPEVLTVRLAVLELYSQKNHDLQSILKLLFPKYAAEKVREAGPGSNATFPMFSGIISNLGIPRRTSGSNLTIDISKLRLMPHEEEFFKGRRSDLFPALNLNADEIDLASDLCGDLWDAADSAGDLIEYASSPPDVDLAGAEPVAWGIEEVVTKLEDVASEIARMGSRPLAAQAHRVISMACKAVLEVGATRRILEKRPEWVRRLRQLTE